MKSSLIKLTVLSLFTFILMSFSLQENWFLYKSKENGYQVLYPKEPIHDSSVIVTDMGSLGTHYSMLTDSELEAENMIYMVINTKYPEKELNSNDKKGVTGFFRRAIDGAVDKTSGNLLSEKVITYGDYPGREIKIASQNGNLITKMRIYLIENNSFIIETTYKKERENNPSAMKFMDSFEILI